MASGKTSFDYNPRTCPVNIRIPAKKGSKMGGAPTPEWCHNGFDDHRQIHLAQTARPAELPSGMKRMRQSKEPTSPPPKLRRLNIQSTLSNGPPAQIAEPEAVGGPENSARSHSTEPKAENEKKKKKEQNRNNSKKRRRRRRRRRRRKTCPACGRLKVLDLVWDTLGTDPTDHHQRVCAEQPADDRDHEVKALGPQAVVVKTNAIILEDSVNSPSILELTCLDSLMFPGVGF